jgi:hypothetical protein
VTTHTFFLLNIAGRRRPKKANKYPGELSGGRNNARPSLARFA